MPNNIGIGMGNKARCPPSGALYTNNAFSQMLESTASNRPDIRHSPDAFNAVWSFQSPHTVQDIIASLTLFQLILCILRAIDSAWRIVQSFKINNDSLYEFRWMLPLAYKLILIPAFKFNPSSLLSQVTEFKFQSQHSISDSTPDFDATSTKKPSRTQLRIQIRISSNSEWKNSSVSDSNWHRSLTLHCSSDVWLIAE